MANLLERASIVLTPTGFNNGEALCVKPDDGSGDFQFSRNSAATRVNAQGLVEDVQILSGNLVQNGDFSEQGAQEVSNGSFTNGETDWTFGTGWSIGEDKAISDGVSSNSNLATTSAFYSGSLQVKMSISVTDYVSGTLKIYLSSTNFAEITSNGEYTFYTTADRSDGKLYLKSVNFNGSITNISVKEVGQNWTFPNDWEVGNNKIIGLGSGFGGLMQTISLQNKKIKVTFDILDYVSGTFRVPPTYRQDGLDERFSGNGSYEVIYTSLVDFFTFQPQLFDGSITNISVIEITDDTNLPRINYEGFSYQDALGSELVTNGDYNESGIGNVISQSGGILVNENNQLKITSNGSSGFSRGVWDTNGSEGQQFLIKADIISVSGSTRFIDISNNQGQSLTQGTTFSAIITLGSATKQVGFGGLSDTSFELIIDNVSVKEYLGQEVVPDSGCGSWLWEPQSTNLITYSEDFGDSSWSKTNSTIVANSTISPDGTLNADKVVENSAISYTRVRQSFSFISGNSYSFSVFYKANGRNFIHLELNTSAFPTTSIGIFDVGTGTVNNVGAGLDSASIKDFGNGWYRCIVTATADTTTGALVAMYVSETASISYQGDGVSGGYIWGAQVEQQSYATSYIPTEGTQKTRNQDVCTNGGSVSTINSTEGVLYFEGSVLSENTGTFRSIALSDGTLNNRIIISYTDATNMIRVLVFRSNGLQVIMDRTINATDTNKIAVKYELNEVDFWINGVKVGTDTNAFMPIGLNELSFSRGDGGLPFFGKTKCLAVWKEALSDEELTLLTTI